VTEQGSLPPRTPAGSAPGPADDALSADWPPPSRRRGRGRSRGRGRGQRRGPLFWAVPAAVVIVIVVVVVVLIVPGRSTPAPVTPGSLITTFLPGEVQKVPDACPSVPAATVDSYLSGQPKAAAPPPLDGPLDSQCDWTLDARPVYRLLQLDIQAYPPNGLASGDGSATFAAIDAYAEAMQQKQDPAAATGAPRAQVTVVPKLGTAAFTATQVYVVGGAITDVATTIIRYRNVLITVVLNGLDRSNNGGYGPVSVPQLSAASLAVARAASSKLT
jgi:hypothetical protein